MKQVLQNLRTGETEVVDVPTPVLSSRGVLMAARCSLVSAGTERMLVEFGKAGLIGKARQQPDRVRAVLEKMRTDGLLTTVDAVRSKLDQPLPLGYCASGTVVEVGPQTHGLHVGDRIVSNSPHAELAFVPQNLCARIPENVSDENAAFTVVGAIALQGIRLAAPTLGETIVVMGLGLIGLLAVQLLRANGCRVIGMDFDRAKLELAESFGAQTVDLSREVDPVTSVVSMSQGRGVDAVLICASTSSSDPVRQAARMSRKRGRIVLVGVTGLHLERGEFFEKELSFQVSCSYGPGRYDPSYESGGVDYPIGYVRWTEQRNFEAVLEMMASGAVNPAPLISHRFPIEGAQNAYRILTTGEPSLGIVLSYDTPASAASARSVSIAGSAEVTPGNGGTRGDGVSVIGAGNYAGRILLPALADAGARMRVLVSATGVSSVHQGRRFRFAQAATDVTIAIEDADTAGIVIATRHDTHADLAIRAIESGRAVFVEKPLALTVEELERIRAACEVVPGKPRLMIGFNRRFSPLALRMRELLAGQASPKVIVATMNAGSVPATHWTQDPTIGGGRIIGEACHFIDLVRFLVGQPIVSWRASAVPRADGLPPDTAVLTFRFADDSIATVNYVAIGHQSYPKERIEAFMGGRVVVLDNFRKLVGYGFSRSVGLRLWRQDKGQKAAAAAFLEMMRTGTQPIPLEELFEVSGISIEVARALSEDRDGLSQL